ncbi:hypothetical protein UO65_1840 [Actinokineospora spheciospongiae]|uniref:DUF8017 domain-containing protein n=1 Tax=Actinokineospora spheciospongiae TaxID=909613 RepID=W7J1J5_9PSEU|nr:hypothetical protein [Actinokineospora spheciospongiae]EWC62806.1 hypothetical protein UO65_1840 [Actinokineospora spheciospongiae]
MTYPGGQYQGLGLFDEPPPPRRTGRIAAVAVAAVVVIVGAVVAVVLLNRGDDGGGPGPTTGPTTTAQPTTEAPPGEVVANEDAHVAYTVPDGWVASGGDPITLPSMSGLSISALAGSGEYACEGRDYSRGFAGSGTAPAGEINKVASDIAHAVGTDGYTGASGLEVSVGTPKAVKRTGDGGAGVDGVQVEATVTTSGSACLSTRGLVVVTVLRVADGLRFVVVNGDTEGGPADPPPVDRAALLAVADSARPIP